MTGHATSNRVFKPVQVVVVNGLHVWECSRCGQRFNHTGAALNHEKRQACRA